MRHMTTYCRSPAKACPAQNPKRLAPEGRSKYRPTSEEVQDFLRELAKVS